MNVSIRVEFGEMVHLTTLQSAIQSYAALATSSPLDTRLAPLLAMVQHPKVHSYLVTCLPTQTYIASGIRIHPLDRIIDEIAPNTSPGGYLFPYGYIVIATSVGGNAICVHTTEGHIIWADHNRFWSGGISYWDFHDKQWIEAPFEDTAIAQAVTPLANDLEVFLNGVLQEQWYTILEALD